MKNYRPSIIERLRLARNVFSNGLPWQPMRPAARKQAPFSLWPLWKQDQPEYSLVATESYIEEGFNQNALVYAAIMYKAKSMAQAPARAYKGDRDKPERLDDSHPLSKLCQRPNPSQSWAAFSQMQSIWLNLAGEAFTYIKRAGGVGGVPSELWPMNPLNVGIIPRDGNRVDYTYTQQGKTYPIKAEDVSHVKFPNPGDPLGGMGHGLPPLSSAARCGDVDNSVTDFLFRFFRSGTMMNVYITFDVPLDDDVMQRTKERAKELYGGYQKWAEEIGVFDSGGKVERLGMNFDEMDFTNIDARNETRILMCFGQGLPLLIGSKFGLERAIYDNYGPARKAFWQDTMKNEIIMFEDDFQYYIQSDDGGFIAFDTSGIAELQPDKPALAAAYASLVSTNSMTPEGAAAFLGIELPDNAIPAKPTMPAPPKPTTPPTEDTESGDDMAEATEDERGDKGTGSKTAGPFETARALEAIDEMDALVSGQLAKYLALKEDYEILKRHAFTPEQKAAHWKAVDTLARTWEPRFADASRKVFDSQRRGLLAVLGKAKARAQRRKATVDWQAVEKDALEYLAEAGDEWRSTFIPLVQGVVTEQGKRWAAELGIQFDVQNLPARDWFNQYVLKFAQEVNATTNDAIRQIMAKAQAEGSSIPNIQKQLDALFETWMDGAMPDDPDWEWFTDRLPAYRTEMIARTETIRSSNAGSTALFEEWGVEKKEWLSTKDGRTRSYDKGDEFDHVEADGQVVGINEPFVVSGEELMYPGDPSGSPGNTIQCRCTVLPVL